MGELLPAAAFDGLAMRWHESRTAHRSQVYLYLWDQASQWSWMCSVPVADFVTITAKARKAKSEWENLRGALAQVIHDALQQPDLEQSTEMTDKIGNPLIWADSLGLILSAYIGTTQTFEVAGPSRCRSDAG